MHGTFTIPVDVDVEEYDPWAFPYGKAPPALFASTVQHTFPLKDFRHEVFNEEYSIKTSREFLRKHGFTAVRHESKLHQSPYGHVADFCDVQLMSTIYYPEIEELVKCVTGCSQVCITDSLVRMSDADNTVSDASWKKSTSSKNHEDVDKPQTFLHMHKPSPSPPTRVPHWDCTPLGARQTVRQGSQEIIKIAKQAGIVTGEDTVCGAADSTSEESRDIVEQNYYGPRYACFSVWRPVRKVTRDPLAMAPYLSVEMDSRFAIVPHQIKQPGVEGDWLKELATLKFKDHNSQNTIDTTGVGLQWHYISNQENCEVLLIKSFDSAALPSQNGTTGEAAGVPHASPDIGAAGFGDARASIEVRVLAFW